MILSILICSLKSREEQLKKLLQHLDSQIGTMPVELMACADEGVISIGEKRNSLVRAATGKYVCFVDDDDTVDDDYVPLLVDACEQDKDCVGIVGEILWRGKKMPFVHSIRYKVYSNDEHTFYRPPNHLNPIRREIAARFKFPSKNHGEDFDWSMQLVKANALKTEAFVPKPVYFYVPFHK